MKKKRFLALFLCACMTTGMYSMPVLAEDATEITVDAEATGENEVTLTDLTIGGILYHYADLSGVTDKDVQTYVVTDGAESTSYSFTDLNQIEDTNIYYTVDKNAQALSGMLYGTDTLSYSEFYSGDTTTAFDAVTTATVNKASKFEDASYYTNANDGTTIDGVKDVNIAVDADIYVRAAILSAASALPETGVYAMAAGITLNAEQTVPSSYYKILQSDGSYSALQTTPVAIGDASAVITTTSNWGDYQIDITEATTSYLTTDTFAKAELQGVILETTEGTKYGLGYLENIWIKAYEMSFFVSADSAAVKSGSNYAQFADIQGKTIAKITFIAETGVYEYDLTSSNLYVKSQLTNDQTITGDSQVTLQNEGTKVNMDCSNLPDGYTLSSVVSGTGRNKVTVTGATYDAETKTLTLPAGSVADSYTVTFSSDLYADASFSFTTELNTSAITLKDKTATYTGKEVTIDAATVTGSTGAVTYTYYSDAACTTALTGAPANAGTYYVKATVAADEANTEATSEAAKLVIKQAASSVKLTAKTVTYTGKTVNIGAAAVTGSTGTVTYKYYSDMACTKVISAPKNAGTYYVKATVAANGNYAAATSGAVKLVINQASQKVTAAFSSKTVTYVKSKTYSLSGKASTAVSYISSNTSVATVSGTGKITLKGAGSATITITAAKSTNYKAATKTIKLVVKPAAVKISSVKNSASKKITVKWAKGANVDGYQIKYVTGKTTKTVTVAKGSTVSKTISSLKKGNTYKVSVRTYKTINGKKYYSSYSTAKSIKISK